MCFWGRKRIRVARICPQSWAYSLSLFEWSYAWNIIDMVFVSVCLVLGHFSKIKLPVTSLVFYSLCFDSLHYMVCLGNNIPNGMTWSFLTFLFWFELEGLKVIEILVAVWGSFCLILVGQLLTDYERFKNFNSFFWQRCQTVRHYTPQKKLSVAWAFFYNDSCCSVKAFNCKWFSNKSNTIFLGLLFWPRNQASSSHKFVEVMFKIIFLSVF